MMQKANNLVHVTLQVHEVDGHTCFMKPLSNASYSLVTYLSFTYCNSLPYMKMWSPLQMGLPAFVSVFAWPSSWHILRVSRSSTLRACWMTKSVPCFFVANGYGHWYSSLFRCTSEPSLSTTSFTSSPE